MQVGDAHTKHCTHCQTAYRNLEAVKYASLAVLGVSLLGDASVERTALVLTSASVATGLHFFNGLGDKVMRWHWVGPSLDRLRGADDLSSRPGDWLRAAVCLCIRPHYPYDYYDYYYYYDKDDYYYVSCC